MTKRNLMRWIDLETTICNDFYNEWKAATEKEIIKRATERGTDDERAMVSADDVFKSLGSQHMKAVCEDSLQN